MARLLLACLGMLFGVLQSFAWLLASPHVTVELTRPLAEPANVQMLGDGFSAMVEIGQAVEWAMVLPAVAANATSSANLTVFWLPANPPSAGAAIYLHSQQPLETVQLHAAAHQMVLQPVWKNMRTLLTNRLFLPLPLPSLAASTLKHQFEQAELMLAYSLGQSRARFAHLKSDITLAPWVALRLADTIALQDQDYLHACAAYHDVEQNHANHAPGKIAKLRQMMLGCGLSGNTLIEWSSLLGHIDEQDKLASYLHEEALLALQHTHNLTLLAHVMHWVIPRMGLVWYHRLGLRYAYALASSELAQLSKPFLEELSYHPDVGPLARLVALSCCSMGVNLPEILLPLGKRDVYWPSQTHCLVYPAIENSPPMHADANRLIEVDRLAARLHTLQQGFSHESH